MFENTESNRTPASRYSLLIEQYGDASIMKYIVAVIQPQQLPSVKKALREANIEHMSCTNILGTVPNQDEYQTYRGVEHEITLFQKLRLELFISDEWLEPVIKAICDGGRETGGSGKIFVMELKEVVTVSTGDRGSAEISN